MRRSQKGDNAVNIFRRLSMVFYTDKKLDQFEAPPILTPEEVCINAAIQEIRQELIELVKQYANKPGVLTDYQKIVFEGILANQTTEKIASALQYEKPHAGCYAVYACLHGYNKRVKSGKRVGGMYRRLHSGTRKHKGRQKHKGLINSPRVKTLLDILELINGGDYKVALSYLKTTESADFWCGYEKEVIE